MIKSENGRVLGFIIKLVIRFLVTIILAIVVAYATLQVLNVDVRFEDGKIALINRNNEYKFNVIDDEYPNIADYQEDSYYYMQLNDTAKALYLGIQDNLENMKSGDYKIDFGTRFNKLLQTESGQDELSIAYQDAVDALKLDNPGLFYIDFSKVYINTYSETIGDRTTYTVYIDQGDNENYFIKGISSKADVVKATTQAEDIKDMIVAAVPENSTNYEKILYIHDWLIENVQYDQTLSRTNRSNVYGTLMEKYVTCQGYAKTFKYIMDSLSVPCIVVKGEATNSEGTTEKHVWNYVMINDKWYAVDVTWDDPIVIGKGEVSKETRYKNFCKGKSFLSNHTEEGTEPGAEPYFKYPELIDD